MALSLSVLRSRLGLPKHSDRIYTVIEKGHGLLIADIVREASVHRPAAYRALRALTQARLVSTYRSGARTRYRAAPRTQWNALFSNEEDALRASDPAPIRFFSGDDTVRRIFDDVVAHTPRGGTFYRYTSERNVDDVNALLSPSYRILRDKKKLERLVISNMRSGKTKKPRLERFVRFLDGNKESFEQNVIQLVYGERVAIIDLTLRRGFIIEDATLASFQTTIFRALYRRLH